MINSRKIYMKVITLHRAAIKALETNTGDNAYVTVNQNTGDFHG
ncbi:hypothetical protein P4574_25535 [Priestia megaterium]|nr:hypothetical protein [Priestia megaterium]MED3872346.1 hypothetical protein [Priestia megaterium]